MGFVWGDLFIITPSEVWPGKVPVYPAGVIVLYRQMTRCQKRSSTDIENECTIVGAKLFTLNDQVRVSEDEQPLKT